VVTGSIPVKKEADNMNILKNYEAMVLSCIDPRFQNFVNKENAKKGLTNKYSAFTIGGGSIGVVAQTFKEWHQYKIKP
jgi:carbonic anhydrase